MLKRALIILSILIAIVVAAEPVQKVHGIIMTDGEWLAMNTVNTPDVDGDTQKGNGNGFVRALKAPFKAFGRLFGKGKKNENKLERISETDAKKFESVQGSQVARTTTVEETGFSESARESEATSFIGNNAEETLHAMATVHLERGRVLLNNHDLNGAIAELSRAASANPNLSEASSLLGVAYWRKGLRDLAERSFENAVSVDNDNAQNNAQNLNNLGFLLYENGDYEKATKYLKRAAKLTPSDARIWNNLGLAQSERGRFDDAYESFARAQGEYKGHLNVAARLEHRGSTKKAIKHLEKAMAIQPNSPDILARLIELYDQTGNEKRALSARTSLETLRAVATTVEK